MYKTNFRAYTKSRTVLRSEPKHSHLNVLEKIFLYFLLKVGREMRQ